MLVLKRKTFGLFGSNNQITTFFLEKKISFDGGKSNFSSFNIVEFMKRFKSFDEFYKEIYKEEKTNVDSSIRPLTLDNVRRNVIIDSVIWNNNKKELYIIFGLPDSDYDFWIFRFKTPKDSIKIANDVKL